MKWFNKEKSRNLRRLRYGTASVVLTIVVIIAVLLLNVVMDIVADRYPLTLDMSEDKVFTLSDESVAIAKAVKNDVEIIVFKDESFFTDPVPGGITELVGDDVTVMREFHTALQQYRSLSGDKVTYKFIDPDLEPEKFAPATWIFCSCPASVIRPAVLRICAARRKKFITSI